MAGSAKRGYATGRSTRRSTRQSRLSRSSSAVRIPLKRHDTLSRHGYGGMSKLGANQGVKRLSVAARHAALVRASRDYGTTYVIRKLNVLAIYTKNKDPALSQTYRADLAFVQQLARKAGAYKGDGSARTAGSRASRTGRRSGRKARSG